MKYMLMMFGDATTMREERSPEWIGEMMAFMDSFITEVAGTGELVHAHGLDVPSTARIVSLDPDGQVVVTDGPFAEAKESLAGFWILDVKDLDRAVEMAGRVAVYAGRVELRPVPDGPSEQ